LLKLHGSINWAECAECRQVLDFNFCDIDFRRIASVHSSVHLPVTAQLPKMEHCGTKVSDVPFLVPPTWNKNATNPSLLNVWKRAAQELTTAENIFVIGYSLPATDLFFRYLFALGTTGPTRIKRFWVFNRDPTGATESRFRELVGPALRARFRYIPCLLSGVASILSTQLGS
jgi:NAD-dependent SIR2 family protein deacetylase